MKMTIDNPSKETLIQRTHPETWKISIPKRPTISKTNSSVSRKFEIVSDYSPSGDQPQAIKKLTQGLNNNIKNQTLLGVTGSGKTFTMAHIIQNTQRPALILAQNKTLAAQLYGEMKGFFPNNAVSYFVSYYDYFQPEAYIPKSDTYIDKESSINEQIDRLRHEATRNLLERRDAIIVASVSCLYGIGSVTSYADHVERWKVGERLDPQKAAKCLNSLQYKRRQMDFRRGSFRVTGDLIEIFPSHLQDQAWRISVFGDEIEKISAFDPLTGEIQELLQEVVIYANTHFVTARPALVSAMKQIKEELGQQLQQFNNHNKLIESQRLEQRTLFDLEMMEATGVCPGIENYSRLLTGRKPGQPPPTLFEYLPTDALLFVDESHVSVPQIRGMFKGDYSRKSTLAAYGFRLPSCIDNRPLRFEEWDILRPQTIYVSATPGDWEYESCKDTIVEQLIRPTGLMDPPVTIRPVEGQVEDVIDECLKRAKLNQRVLITTLTKKLAENLQSYLNQRGIRARYLHSDIDTLERIAIIHDLRLGAFDVLVGINLLREGLDIPECTLVAILDADKEGFLRSRRSLIQTIGRAARNIEGEAILYADVKTESIKIACLETSRRRKRQLEYNKKHNITPQSIKSKLSNVLSSVFERDNMLVEVSEFKELTKKSVGDWQAELEKRMYVAASELNFETASILRDERKRLDSYDTELPANSIPLSEAMHNWLSDREKPPSRRETAKREAKARARRVAKQRATAIHKYNTKK